MASPGTGAFRANNAAWASVTILAIYETSADSGNPNTIPWLDNIPVGASVHITDVTTPGAYAIYTVTATTQEGSNTWVELAVTYVTQSGTFTNGDRCEIAVYGGTGSSGVAGPTGVSGATGASVTGPTGVSGATGVVGPTGVSGATGVAGPTGVSGATGVAGATGPTGVSGATGIVGATGPLGSSGLAAIEFVIDGGGAAIATGLYGFLDVPFACTINAARLYANQTGTITVDIWVCAYANFPPTIANTITASDVPTISSGVDYSDTTLTGWTTSIAAGSVIGYNVTGVTSIQRVTCSLGIARTNMVAAGATGASGITGPTGVSGATGAGGPTGPSGGPTGATGISGATGVTGPTGVSGATGVVGPTGVSGATGPIQTIIPQNSKSADYTTVIGDAGEQIFHPGSDTTPRTFTIAANSSVAYPIGTAITFVNDSGAGALLIAITSDTMYLAGAVSTTGSRTLTAVGVATALKVNTTEWIISGVGLT
jgi:hypothetical protein